jgi:hypothetical protein
LTVSDALKIAGSGHEAAARIEAIRAVTALATSLKDQRVMLCEAYNECKVTLAEHGAKDQRLAGGMRSLIDLWNKRTFSRSDEIARFRERVQAIDLQVNGSNAKASPPKTLRAEEALAAIEGAGVSWKRSAGAVTVVAQGEGGHRVLHGRPEAMPLLAGHHYRIKVKGSYTPAEPPLIQPGDELVAKLKYRATQAGELYLALRSLEDPDAIDSTTTWPLKPGDTGSREVNLTASPQASGFYVGIGVRNGGPVDLDDIELSRRGKPIAAAQAEAAREPAVKTDCTGITDKPLAGSKSLRCQAGDGDRVSLGMPASYLFLALRVPRGDRAMLRTLSLEGGRSVDATVAEEAEFVIGLEGAGSVTIQSVEVGEVAP